jgi:2-dehydropantoate 2-reductase
MDIVVFGAGSLGSLLGGLLAREHPVTLVGRDPHVRRVREDGLRIEGAIETTVQPNVDTEPPTEADLALICVKAFDTPAAAAALAETDLQYCLSVQNGLGNEETLAARLDTTVLAGTCTYGAMRESPGIVRCTGIGEVTLGPLEGEASVAADRLGETFESAGVVTTVAEDMPYRLWEKLAVNAGINATTALARVDNGALLDGDAGTVARAAAREVAAVATTEGVDLSAEDAVSALESVAEATAANTSSMQQDVLAERRTEVDAINGSVVERGEETDLNLPVNGTLTRLLCAWERGRGLR